MRITKTEEFGMRLVIRLAAERGQMTVAELAEKEALAEPTVGKLLNRLKSSGLVDSVRGRGGGYELSRPADRVTVSDVLAALGQQTLSGNACTTNTGEDPGCPHLRRCNLRPVWRHVEGLITQVFEQTTIADLLAKEGRVLDHLSRVSSRPGLGPEATKGPDGPAGPRVGPPVSPDDRAHSSFDKSYEMKRTATGTTGATRG